MLRFTTEGAGIWATLVVRDGIDPQAAHQQFLKIDEYRRLVDGY
jgi:hypothetical protein